MGDLKGYLFGHWAGALALSARSRIEMIRVACSRPERVGCLANDQLAERLLTTICRSGARFIDVGAHIGSIIYLVARNNKTVKLIAVEATPEKAANLRRRFPNVELFDCAVGESHGEISFFVRSKLSGYNSLIRPQGGSDDSVKEIKVPLRKIDELVTASDVDVMKIDVEGAELGVLRGSVAMLSRCRPTILFESGAEATNAFGYTKEALFEFFASNNYCVVLPNRMAHNDPGLGIEGFLESHLYPRRTTNYFAVAKERRTEIRDRARELLGIA
jgi:FkbM family methyltransferase